MTTVIKPMLAGAPPPADQLRFPLMVSPKLDGIRCLVVDGVAMSRNWKPIPNRHVQKLLGTGAFNGMDGELIVGDPGSPEVYRDTMKGVMSEDGTPNVRFFVFDNFGDGYYRMPFKDRFATLANVQLPAVQVEHEVIFTKEDLDECEARRLGEGYEGLILRDPEGPYKHGRSSTKEGWLLKLKRFSDAEAQVVGFEELMKNGNAATKDAFGHTERSSHKDNMIPMGTLGALVVRSKDYKVDFKIGTGFDAKLRQNLWNGRGALVGQYVKFKFFDGGSKDAPRFPVFISFRDPRDMSEG